MVLDDIITFDVIYECWKTKKFPENFDELLEKYLNMKKYLFGSAKINEPTAWMNKILISIAIGEEKNSEKFFKYEKIWREILGRKWAVSIEDKWVVWKN